MKANRRNQSMEKKINCKRQMDGSKSMKKINCKLQVDGSESMEVIDCKLQMDGSKSLEGIDGKNSIVNYRWKRHEKVKGNLGKSKALNG